MLDITFIRENPQVVKEALKKRGMNEAMVDRLLELDAMRRSSLKAAEDAAAEHKKLSKAIAKEKGDSKKITLMLAEARELAKRRDEATHILKEIQAEYTDLLHKMPNVPQEDVPVGRDENDNVVVRENGKKEKFQFEPKDYLHLAEELDIIDVKRAAKVSGSRFGYLKGAAVQLEFALVRFALDELAREGFIPIVPPVLIKEEMMRGMGYIDTPEDLAERYILEKDHLFLVGTSEQAVGPMHAKEVFEEKDLPRRYVAFSSCFRREAGSYGKDTKGILRVHQFDKVEMFSFAHPDASRKEHLFLLSMAEHFMQKLEIPYRVVQLCTGDLARPSAATYDIESWLPGQNQYRETHSISNTTDFQARRLNVRYRTREGRFRFVHMLNGTAFAIGRMLIAIIENYQQGDGSVKVPKVLQQYCGFEIIKR
jgi:seryl-tRNA synthetase